MMQKKIAGAGVAIITPFTPAGEIDYPALEKLVQMHIDCGTDFLCVHGTTGETPTLTVEEKRESRKRIIEQVAGRLPIMLGLGGNNTQAVVNELRNEDLTGIDAILSIVPYYNKPNQEGMYQHFKAIAAATELPIYLYNVPGRTGVQEYRWPQSRVGQSAADFASHRHYAQGLFGSLGRRCAHNGYYEIGR